MAKTAERNEQMCWCISRFALRYEYRDDKDKKGVLQYTRQYVAAGADPESRHFMDQLDELKEKKKLAAFRRNIERTYPASRK